jgi:ATP-dependent Clp protease adaptor protein ClpS
VSVAPAEVDLPKSADQTADKQEPDKPWVTIVWNDPINLMPYVTYVFQKVFAYPKPKAEKLMLDVHHKGKAVVAAGARESMEHNAEILHGYGLWATVNHDS